MVFDVAVNPESVQNAAKDDDARLFLTHFATQLIDSKLNLGLNQGIAFFRFGVSLPFPYLRRPAQSLSF